MFVCVGGGTETTQIFLLIKSGCRVETFGRSQEVRSRNLSEIQAVCLAAVCACVCVCGRVCALTKKKQILPLDVLLGDITEGNR